MVDNLVYNVPPKLPWGKHGVVEIDYELIVVDAILELHNLFI